MTTYSFFCYLCGAPFGDARSERDEEDTVLRCACGNELVRTWPVDARAIIAGLAANADADADADAYRTEWSIVKSDDA